MTNTQFSDTMMITNLVLTVAPIKEETKMLGAITNKITALYCRLSQEDERLGESLSIENQAVFYGTHFIRESVLERLVLRHIQLVTDYILHHRQHFISVMERSLQLESAEKLECSRKQLERCEHRISELKRLFIKIYEDNVKGKLNDERFDMLSQSYETEQKQLEAEVIVLRQEIEVQERQNENIEKFICKANKYVGIEEIDPAMLRELIQAIYVEAPDKSSGKRKQHIHIKYDGIGFIPLDELMKHE